jgi:hypothetical protein
MRVKNEVGLSRIEKEGDGGAIASENIILSKAPEEQDIRFPRASTLYDACMRMYVIGTKEMKSLKNWSSVKGRITFGIGNAIHYWVQNDPDLFGDKRRGWWKCLACGKVVGFGAPPTKKCRFCKAKKEAIQYHEHYFKMNGPLFVTGHIDMFIKKEDALRITEVKSIGGAAFEELVAPLVGHEYQLQTYMWAMSKQDRLPIDTDLGYVLYISKRHAGKTFPVKMYPVERDPKTIHRIENKLQVYADGVASYPRKLPPPIRECLGGKFSNYRAKSCPCLKECTA